MAQHILLGAVSTSSSFTDSKKDQGSIDNQARWESLKTFLYLAGTFSGSNVNFDLFSGAIHCVPMWLYLFLMVSIGIPYMCVDLFIKQYTGKLDLNESLIPLLKAVNYSIMLQSVVWNVIHACDLSDAIFFFFSCMMGMPSWLSCQGTAVQDGICIPMLNVSLGCDTSKKVPEDYVSHHNFYRKLFLDSDKILITRKIFLIAIVWLINFFITTLSEPVLLKFFKLAFVFRSALSVFLILYVGLSSGENLVPAVRNILAQEDYELIYPLSHVMLAYGVGLVGVYDFGSMSPFTSVDNAVVVFAVSFTLIGFLRSLSVKVLYDLVANCVHMKKVIHYHYLLMAILPAGSIFIHLQRLIMILIYLNMIATLCPHMAAITCTVAKMLHSEFRAVKNVYFSGLLSFFGFLLSSVIDQYFRLAPITVAGTMGLFSCMLYLALLKISIIMYIYGVQKFATDIHFWLGYKPSLYWIISWSLMPVILLYCAIVMLMHTITFNVTDLFGILWRLWVLFSLLLVIIILSKVVGRYATQNKLLAVLRPSPKYGPPDADERKRRQRYDETVTLRQCVHDCVPLDDRFDCNHVSRAFQKPSSLEQTSEMSIHHIFEADTLRAKGSELFDVQQMRD